MWCKTQPKNLLVVYEMLIIGLCVTLSWYCFICQILYKESESASKDEVKETESETGLEDGELFSQEPWHC